MTSEQLLEPPLLVLRQALAFAPAFASAVLADDRRAELLQRLRDTVDPAAALRAVVEHEDLALDVARVQWLTTNVTSPARWLAEKVAAIA